MKSGALLQEPGFDLQPHSCSSWPVKDRVLFAAVTCCCQSVCTACFCLDTSGGSLQQQGLQCRHKWTLQSRREPWKETCTSLISTICCCSSVCLQDCAAPVQVTAPATPFYTESFNSAFFWHHDILIRSSLVMFQRTAALPCLKPTGSLLFEKLQLFKDTGCVSPTSTDSSNRLWGLLSCVLISPLPRLQWQHLWYNNVSNYSHIICL